MDNFMSNLIALTRLITSSTMILMINVQIGTLIAMVLIKYSKLITKASNLILILMSISPHKTSQLFSLNSCMSRYLKLQLVTHFLI